MAMFIARATIDPRMNHCISIDFEDGGRDCHHINFVKGIPYVSSIIPLSPIDSPTERTRLHLIQCEGMYSAHIFLRRAADVGLKRTMCHVTTQI